MSKFKFKLNTKGVQELLQSEEMQTHLTKLASGIQSRCGDGYASDVKQGKKRAYVNIYPETKKAKKDNNKNNTLLKAVR